MYKKIQSVKKKIICIFISILYLLINILEQLIKEKKYQEGKKYIDKCINNTYITNCHHQSYDSPILSIIIPTYNCQDSILFSISSIQNQNICNFEIILINDFSQDNTSKILIKLEENDKRVRIINNKRNMGTLYSRCVGTLISKGEYIFPLDNDDMIFGEDIFEYTYKKAKDNNYDIVGFKAIGVKRYSENIDNMKDLYKYTNPNNLIVNQPG